MRKSVKWAQAGLGDHTESGKTRSDREDAVGAVLGEGWGLAIQAQESAITEKAEGGGSGIKGWRVLRAQWRQAENAPNKLEEAARKLPSDCATGPGDAILPGQESQEREACFSTALKGKHSSWGSYPQE